MKTRKFQVLLVEDSSADAHLLSLLMAQACPSVELHTVRNGQEASDFVLKQSGHETKPTPDLILLDLNLPIKSGRELLPELKTNPRTCAIPVLMLSTSGSDGDVEDAYRLGANGFVCKPVDLNEYQTVVKTICDYWFRCLRLVVADTDGAPESV